ncbi:MULTISPECIES: DeoR/GlpR family DNA-binding transcription regulator [Modicisalibacter]|uniref:DeoR/GlpR family DNA-binding transcription regulator n=1 Tax=Modicisalibacter TaxID=574347 RepID=UPI00100AFBDE|nr:MULTISPECIES: DeoR/GlpR family DNA-binding transcription regulator [Halomonadaceae]MBZ9557498.1 DeoR/GlpR transcriptional regulator [Modicisalibacter sp. R2A 31.J]MBZ9573836.1 DeoR/GlpR transcriptional regulator [Modicisalibacter sp. MOD 31.J]
MTRKPRKDERHARILEVLRYTPHVRIATLATRFGVTTETIRRDLDALSDQGLLDRAHGGAVARPMGIQPPIDEREQATVDERRAIAHAAARLVEPGQVVMIDAGSTTTQLAWRLGTGDRALTVITNSYPVASAMASSTSRLILCPGDFNAREGGVFGQDTTDYLARFHANLAFIGASGLTGEGILDVNRDAAWVKRTLIARSERTYLLVDHTKFAQTVLELVAPLSAIDGIVTDRPPPESLARHLQRADVTVHVAGPVTADDPQRLTEEIA